MDIPDKPSYTHGSTGTKPTTALDYANGDPLDADNLDYYLYTEFTKIKALIDVLNTLDSDGDGRVDAADHATEADNASQLNGNTYDDDGDGRVNAADHATEAASFEARTNYPTNPDNGRVVFRTDKT